MLQWMGGGRRKVKAFFEQKRQQLRSQGAEELIFHKTSQPLENVYSLDIASLKNLSKLAPPNANDQSEGSKNTSLCTSKPGCAEDVRKTSCLGKNGGTFQNNDLQGTGHDIEPPHDAAAHSRATVGTQWTPASASAAAALLCNEPVDCPKAPITVLREGLQAEVIERKQEENLHKTPYISKEEKHIKNNLGPRKPSRLKKFEEFQILDLIKSTHNSEQQKKDAQPEKYAAYVLEGMGQVANCTPKNNVGCNKTRNEDVGPIRKAKHGKQELPCHATKDQEGRKKSKAHLQRHSFSTVDEERGSITDLESFADSNGKQWSRERHAGRDDSLGDLQHLGERILWSSSRSMNPHYNDLSARTSFKERDILSLDYMANLPSPICKISPSYPESPKSAESMGFAVEDDHLFSICSDYGSTNMSYDIDAYMSYDFLLDDDDDFENGYGSQASGFTDGYGSLASDGMQSFEFRGCSDHNILLTDDSSGSAGASPSLFRKVQDCSDALLLTDDSYGPEASTSFAFF